MINCDVGDTVECIDDSYPYQDFLVKGQQYTIYSLEGNHFYVKTLEGKLYPHVCSKGRFKFVKCKEGTVYCARAEGDDLFNHGILHDTQTTPLLTDDIEQIRKHVAYIKSFHPTVKYKICKIVDIDVQ